MYMVDLSRRPNMDRILAIRNRVGVYGAAEASVSGSGGNDAGSDSSMSSAGVDPCAVESIDGGSQTSGAGSTSRRGSVVRHGRGSASRRGSVVGSGRGSVTASRRGSEHDAGGLFSSVGANYDDDDAVQIVVGGEEALKR